MTISLMLVSCSDDDPSSDATATTEDDAAASETSDAAADDVCADREALRSSVGALEDVDLNADGASGVTAALGDVKDDLAAVGDSAGSEVQPQVDDVQSAVDELETAVADLGSGGASDALNAVSEVASTTATLLDSLDDAGCD